MKYSIRNAAGIAGAVALLVAAAAWAEPQVHAPTSANAALLTQPSKDDPHVKQLYEVLKAAHQPGAKVDREKASQQVRAIARDYAVKTGADPAAAEEHVMELVHNIMLKATPESFASLDAFWTTLHSTQQ
jgi:hypothetical protein